MKVDYITHMGTDLTVVNAARVSFDKESSYALKADDVSTTGVIKVLSVKDTKLINYLATHGHWTPFGHCQAQFRIKAPIFVARQLARHQIGLVWNEVSRRYVDTPPEFFYPEGWRRRAENKKQGSSEEIIRDEEQREVLEREYEEAIEAANIAYNTMLGVGAAPELARMVLPQSMYTEWYWTGSLAAFARICKQRLDPHAQYETRVIAVEIDKHMSKLFPVSWKALLEGVKNV